MLTNGFVTILRDIKGSELDGDVKAMGVLLDLMLTVNFKDTKTRGIDLKAGQCIIGIEEYGNKFKMPKNTMRGVLQRIVKAGFADLTPTSKYTIVTLKNCIQKSDHRPQTDLTPTSDRPHTDLLEIRGIKEINVNKGNKEKGAPVPASSLTPTPQITFDFIRSYVGDELTDEYIERVRAWLKKKNIPGDVKAETVYKWLVKDGKWKPVCEAGVKSSSFDVNELEQAAFERYKKSSIDVDLVKEKAYSKYRKEKK